MTLLTETEAPPRLDHFRRLIGPPGTGKSTRLKQLCEEFAQQYGGDKILICSLTRAAASIIGGKAAKLIPYNNVGTLHRFAYRALESPPIADTPKHLPEWNTWIEQQGYSLYRISEGLAKDLDDLSTEAQAGSTAGDEALQAYNLSRARLESVDSLEGNTRFFATLWEQWKTESGYVDFQDLLTLALDIPCAPGEPKVILMDESQDYSHSAIRLANHWASHPAVEHYVSVGDPLQALFAWAGGDPEAMLKPELPLEQVEVLSQSYRVPAKPHTYALRLIEPHKREVEQVLGKEIAYLPRREPGTASAAVGSVRALPSATYKYPEPAIQDAVERYLSTDRLDPVQVDELTGEPVPVNVAFITSCSHMLNPLLAALRREGLPFHNPCRLQRGDWNPLSQRATSSGMRLLNFLRLDERLWPTVRLWNAKELWSWVELCEVKGLLKRGAKEQIKEAASFGLPVDAEGNQLSGELSLADLEGWFEDLNEIITVCELIVEGRAYDWLYGHLLSAKKKPMEFPIAVAKKQPEMLRQRPRITVGTIHSLKGYQSTAAYLFPDLSPSAFQGYLTPGADHDAILRSYYVGSTRCTEELILCQSTGQNSIRWPSLKGL